MVTQRQLTTSKRHLNTLITEAKELIIEIRENQSEWNFGLVLVCKESIEENLRTFHAELKVFFENLPENEENEKIVENYDNIALEGSCLLNQLKGIIKGHQQKLEAEEREKQRQQESEERDKQRQQESEEREKQRQVEEWENNVNRNPKSEKNKDSTN